MAEQPRFAFCPNCVENLIRFSFNGISFLPPQSHLRLFFAFPQLVAGELLFRP
jgi:hypothetical protein